MTLGANEVDILFPRVHAPAIERLAHTLASVAPCLFFDSDAVLGGLTGDERRGDRIHPNERGGARWAEAFWAWLEEHREGGDTWKLQPFERR